MAVSDLSDADLMAALGQGSAPAPTGQPDVEGMVRAEAQRQNVDPDFAVNVARQESGLRHDVKPSPKGAIGVMQLMPGTAGDMGVDPTDLGQNIQGGVRYLGQQLKTFGGDRRLAAAAYNAGPGNVQKYGGVPPFAETQKYVDAVAPGAQGLSDADLMAALGQQGGGDAAPPAQGADAQLPAVVDGETHQPYATPAVQKGLQTLLASGQLDPSAAPGSKAFPRGWKPGFKAGPGEWYVGADGSLKQEPSANVAADVGQSLVSGAAKAGTSLIDTALQASPIGAIPQMLRTAADLGAGGLPTTRPFNGVSSAVDPHLYVPQTTPGRYAAAVGEMLPNAVTPGGLARKAAAVVLPALGSEAAGEVASHFGANPTVTGVARFLGGAAGGLGSGLTLKPAQVGAEAQSLEQIKTAKKAAYAAAENSGATVDPKAANDLVGTVSRLVADKGGADLYPTAARMVSRLKSLVAKGITPTQLDDYRSQIYDQLMADGGKEANIGKAIRGHIDTVLDADPSWKDARDLNTRYMKMQEVTDRLDSAGLRAGSTYSGGNYTNAVRQQIRPLVDPKSAQRLRNLTPDEQAAARLVVNGTPIQNVTRHLGKVLNNKFVQTGLMMVTPHGVGFPLAEAAGGAIKKAGEAQTESAVQRLIDLISTGGVAPQGPRLAFQPGPMEPFNVGTVLGTTRAAPYPTLSPAR